MNDNALVSLIIVALNTGLAAQNIVGVTVQQRYQPTVQGIPSNPTIYLNQIGRVEFGYLKRVDIWNAATLTMEHTEEQPIITTYQINATAIQNPSDTNGLTANDYVGVARSILNSDSAREFLQANGVQVMRIKDGRQTYWKDDKGRFEADPSCDCAFVHSDIVTSTVPSTAQIETGLYPVKV